MDVIGKGEGTITKSGQRIYNKIFGGQRVALGTEHPNVHVPFGGTSSTAAGFGQFLHGTWEMIEKKIGKKLDFSNPHDQELAVAFLMFDRGMIAPLMQGDIAGAIKKGAPEWASLPTSPYGQPTQKMSGALSTYSSRLAAHAGGVQPVAVVQWGQQDITGAAGQIFGGGGGGGGFGQQDIQGGAKAIFGAKPRVLEATADIQSFVQTINDSVPVIVEAQKAQEEEIVLDRKRETAIQYISSVTMKSLTPLEQQRLAEIERTKTAIALTKESQKASREQLIRGQDILGMLGGAVGQIAGMMPQQTVGKKRGLFSKILGIAAPFLNFIPGVGPILSTIAGAASAGLGGNWGGVVSSVAGGLASGGAFNPLRDDKHVDTGAIASTATPMATSIDLKPLIPRAGGGPVYRGARYVVGERGAETFTPAADGFITPHGGGGGLLEAAAELRAAVSHLNSMPASHVVMRGAHGLVRAMDADAGLIRLVSQRQRLA
jgi:muramidase (phage lysozyme)